MTHSIYSRLIAFAFGVVALIGSSYSQNTNFGLIAFYPFDGNANDFSGYNNHGTVNGATLCPDRFNVANRAYYFDGNDDIDIFNAAILNPTAAISISAWYKTVSFTGAGYSPIFTKGFTAHVPPSYQYKIGVTGDGYSSGPAKFGFNVCVNGVSQGVNTSPGFWTPGNWYHLVGTFDGNAVKLYVNGTLQTSLATSGTLTVFPTNLKFGNNTTSGLDYLQGAVDELRLYNRALTAAEVLYLYCGPPSPTVISSNQMCGSAFFNISPVQGATSYSWTTAGGWSGSSSSNSLNVFGSGSGTVNVHAVNACGVSPSASLTLNLASIATLGSISGPSLICNSGHYSVAPVAGVTGYSWTLPSGWTGVTSSNNLTLTGTAPGAGTISVVAINGCGNSMPVSYAVTGGSANISLSANQSVVCLGGQVQLTASGASSYSWNIGTTTSSFALSPTVSAVYVVTGTDAANCVGTQSIQITVLPLPAVNVSSSPTLVCAGESMTLIASGANTYTWNATSNHNTAVVMPGVASSYMVTGTGLNGCTRSVIYSPNVSSCSGIAEFGSQSKLHMHFDPENQTLDVFFPPISNVHHMELRDLQGRLLRQSVGTIPQLRIDVSGISKGCYLVLIHTDQGLGDVAKWIRY